MDGIYDMDKICQKAIKGEPTNIFHNEESLRAVFGDITAIAGSEHDVYTLAKKCNTGKFYITGKNDSKYEEERVRLAEALKDKAVMVETNGEIMDFSEPTVLKYAVDWLCNK